MIPVPINFLKVRSNHWLFLVGTESGVTFNNSKDDNSDNSSAVGFGPRSISRISDNSSHMSAVGVS